MRSVNMADARAQLLDTVEAGEEVVIMRRDRPVARLVPAARAAPFLDRSRFRGEIPPFAAPVEQVVGGLRDDERC